MRRATDKRRRPAALPAVALAGLIGAAAVLAVVLTPNGDATLPSAPVPALAGSSVLAPFSSVSPNPLVARPDTLGSAVLELASRAPSVPVPRSFLGLSLEYWSLPDFESRTTELTRVLALLHPAGSGPGLLRIGGDSADHVYWNVATRSGLNDIHPGADLLRRLSGLVRRADLRIILDLNLAAGLPPMAAGWANLARKTLPRGSIAAFEIGNEPDLYHRQGFYRLAAPRRSPRRLLSTWRHYGVASYETEFAAYAGALARGLGRVPLAGRAPGRVPLAGPAIASPMADPGWIAAVIRADRGSLGMVTAHFYPFAACRPPRSPMYPTIPRLLGGTTSADIVNSVAPAAAEVHRAGLPFRLTEFNSVSCGGRRGVSDTFATALWAPDALFGLVRGGVDGVNLHVRARGINAPFVLVGNGIQARPLLYGLAAFAETLGPDARLLRTRLHQQMGLKLSAWSVRVRGGIVHLLLTNKGNRGATVTLRLPATAPATVRRLTSPAVTATTGVTLGGRSIDQFGQWSGGSVATSVPHGAGGYRVTLPGYSAALVTVQVTSRARG